MASSSVSAVSSKVERLQLDRATGRSQQYPHPLHVHPASIVSTKLSGKTNYGAWQEQMTCLLEIHDMLGFIDGRLQNPMDNTDSKEGEDVTTVDLNYTQWKRSDTLVKGWIFGSLTEDVMRSVVGLHTANDVWVKLKTNYNTPPAASTTNTSRIRFDRNPAKYIPLVRAILVGDWEKAREFFDNDENALTAKLSTDGRSALLHAVCTGENIHFLENLLKKITPELLPTLADGIGYNALHLAALVGNTTAAKLLVEKNPHLLFMVDNVNWLPIHLACFVPHKTTFRYLLEVSKQNIDLCQHQHAYRSPFEPPQGRVLLNNLCYAGLLDEACELINEYPEMLRENMKDSAPLLCLATKLDAYYSGTPYNFYQRFVYSYVPMENKDLGDNRKVQDIENVVTNEGKILAKCSSFFHSVIRTININIWKMTLLHVSHIKHLQEDKVKHKITITLLQCICAELGKLFENYDVGFPITASINEATKSDIPEVVEEIVTSFPQAVWSVDIPEVVVEIVASFPSAVCSTSFPPAVWSPFEGHRIFEMAIINRSQNVYNLLVHQMSDNKYFHKLSKDQDGNNLLHLAANLAPTHKLNAVSGAALQMQRELQWFQEVEKLVLPHHKQEKNKKLETPIMVFRREHKELRKQGEEWMKKTADSYTITAALITTIVFAAAITVPGGNNSDTGRAIYTTKPSFIIFAISDAISLFTSTTSLLLFLSILTARYAEEDFLYSLPKRLIFGLALLFMSMTSMMVAFSATLYLMFGQGKAWIVIPIIVLTSLPIGSFVTLQFPLLYDLISSTYGRGIFGKRGDRRIA